MEQDLDKRFEEYVKDIDALLIEADNEGVDISQLLLRLAYLNLRRAGKKRGESFKTSQGFKFVFNPTIPIGTIPIGEKLP